jgi:hypothetical protein
MAFLVETDNSSTVHLKLEGELRIEDAGMLHTALRKTCGKSTKLIVDALNCTSAEFCILQLLCSAMRSVDTFAVHAYSDEFLFYVDRAGLRRAFRECLSPSEGLRVEGDR